MSEQHCIADEPTTRALSVLAKPLARSVMDVARIAVTDALDPNADRAEPILARLLAIDTPTDAVGVSWSLELRDNPAELVLTHGDAAAAAEAREYLRYLAAPGHSSRWSTPVPVRFTEPPANHRQAHWQSRLAQEAQAAARLLRDWLRLDAIGADGIAEQEWLDRLGVTDEVRPVLTLWFGWLRDRGVLAPEPHRLQPGPRSVEAAPAWDPPVAAIVTTLTHHRDLILRVLTGQTTARELLAVESLRPARLAVAEPALEPVWQQIADLVADHTRTLGCVPAVAELGDATAENPHLRRLGVAGTVLPVGRPHHSAESFDIVLAVGTLHRWADPELAIDAVTSLLRPGGILIALENTQLTPLGMLIAGLVENGFTDAAGEPVATPTQDTATWTRLLAASGLIATHTPVGPTPATLIRAVYSARVERRTPEPERGPIRTEMEADIAQMWAELLPTAPQARQDSFFELGGDSLRATRFIAAVQQRYGATIAMRDLFARPHLAAVADQIAIATEMQEVGVL